MSRARANKQTNSPKKNQKKSKEKKKKEKKTPTGGRKIPRLHRVTVVNPPLEVMRQAGQQTTKERNKAKLT